MNSSGMVEITCDPWSEWKKSLLLAWYLARRNLNVRYRGSVLGYFWGLTYPLMLMVIYIMVFSQILRPDLSENAFAVNFLPAMFAWLWIANVMSHSVFSISQMSSVLHQTFFPRWIIPLATVLAEGVNYVLSVPLLVGGLAALGVFPGWGLLWLLALVPLLLVFTFGIALAISPVAVIYRDTQYLV